MKLKPGFAQPQAVAGMGSASFKDLVIAAIQFIVGEVGVALSHRYASMARELLGKLQVAARASQNGGDKIVSKRMGCDRCALMLAQSFVGAFTND